MRLFPEPLEIGEFEGFAEAKDIFNRKEFGVGLQRLFERVDEPLTVILDSPWGTGKSTFIEMWCGHMRLQGFPVIYFDAFRHDHVEDAFAAIAGEVIAKAENYYVDSAEGTLEVSEKKKIKEKASAFLGVAKRFGKVLAKTGGKGLLQKGAEKFMGEDAVAEIKDSYGELAAELFEEAKNASEAEAERFLEELIDSKIVGRNQQEIVFEEFKQKLGELAVQLREPARKLGMKYGGSVEALETGKRPLIFVIDELDRCKPTFALSVLEMIKHFFAQDGIHFLLVTHVNQLESSVKHAYGINGQENEYLQKFYSLVVKLPSVVNLAASRNYTNKQLADVSKELLEPVRIKLLATADILLKDCTHNFSLRAIERAMAQLRLLLLTLSDDHVQRFPAVLLSLVFVKIIDNEMYTKLLAKESSGFSLSSFWGVPNSYHRGDSVYELHKQWGAYWGTPSNSVDKALADSFKEQLSRSLDFANNIRYSQLYDELYENRNLKDVS